MPAITMTSGLWAMEQPMEHVLEHLDDPLHIWTPPRWDGMTQDEAGYWWTTVAVPEGQTIHDLEDYRALLVWLLTLKQQQCILDWQMEGATAAAATAETLSRIEAVMPLGALGAATIEGLLNFNDASLRRAVFPVGAENCFPVRPEAMERATMEFLTTWPFIDWMGQFRVAVMEGGGW